MSTAALQLALPLCLALWLWFFPARGRFRLILQFLSVAATILAIWQAGLWTVLPRWSLAVPAAIALIALVRGGRKIPAKFGFGEAVQLLFSLALLIVAGGIVGAAWQGSQPPPAPSIKLVSPLKGNDLIVANGGSSLLLNAHQDTLDLSIPGHRLWHGQSYGVDLVALRPLGMTSDGIRPSNPKSYAIFGRPVHAPCSGTVIALSNDRPDLAVPKVDHRNMEGNHIRLSCGDMEVVLAHLQQGSVKVAVGEAVNVGNIIGAVGNSGMSDEPHLHIHAQTPGTAAAPFSGKPVAMLFDNRFLARNDRI